MRETSVPHARTTRSLPRRPRTGSGGEHATMAGPLPRQLTELTLPLSRYRPPQSAGESEASGAAATAGYSQSGCSERTPSTRELWQHQQCAATRELLTGECVWSGLVVRDRPAVLNWSARRRHMTSPAICPTCILFERNLPTQSVGS